MTISQNLTKTNIAAFYGRVSTEDQVDNYSIDGQLKEAYAFCEKNNLQLLFEYTDPGVSGKSITNRPGLQKAIQDAESGKFSHLLVWKLTRLSRKTIDTLQIVDKLNKANVSLRPISEPQYDTSTSSGMLFLTVMAAVAQMERETISDNVRMGMRQCVSQGIWVGGKVYGYDATNSGISREERKQNRSIEGRDKITIIPVPEEAAVIKEIYTRYAKGQGLKKIRSWLNQSGIKGKRGAYFSDMTVRKILDNPLYKGYIRYTSRDQHGRIVYTKLFKGIHEPIISENLWDSVHVMREAKKRCPSRAYERGHLLTGLLRCPECNAVMTMSRTTTTHKDGSKTIYERYCCSRWKKFGSSFCHSNGIITDKAEHLVFKRLNKILCHPTLIHDLMKQVNAQKQTCLNPLKTRLSEIKKEQQTLESSRKKMLMLFDPESIDSNWIKEQLNDVAKKLSILSVEESSLNTQIVETGSRKPVSIDIIKIIMEKFIKELQTVDKNKKGILLKLLIKEIHFEKKKGVTSISMTFSDDVVKALGLTKIASIQDSLTLTA
ncbi:MAG: recombinase family protein [bacterium]